MTPLIRSLSKTKFMSDAEYQQLSAIYGGTELTKDEERVAILKERIAKYFREKNAIYWAEQEAKRPNQAGKGAGKIN